MKDSRRRATLRKDEVLFEKVRRRSAGSPEPLDGYEFKGTARVVMKWLHLMQVHLPGRLERQR